MFATGSTKPSIVEFFRENENNVNMENGKTILTGEQKKIFEKIHSSLSNGIRSAKADAPRQWLKQKGLSVENTGAAFNSGQMHHRKKKEFINELASVNFLRSTGIISKNGDTGYASFGNYAIMFPLRDKENNVVNFYAIRIALQTPETIFLNDNGVYPCYPHELTQRLFITTDILETATLLESKILENRDAVICIPAGNFLGQHEEAILKLKHLKEVVWIENKV